MTMTDAARRRRTADSRGDRPDRPTAAGRRCLWRGLVGIGVLIPAGALALTYDVAIEPTGDPVIDGAAGDASLLLQLEAEPVDGLTLLSRARADLERFEQVMRSEGYYASDVAVTIDGEPVDSEALRERLAEAGEDEAVSVSATLEPGPRYVVEAIEVVGPEDTPSPFRPREPVLTVGDPARSADILAYEQQVLTLMREDARPYAAVPDRRAVVDHTAQTMALTFTTEPGPRAVLGEVSFVGLERTDAGFLQTTIPFAFGTPYAPDRIRELRDDLTELNLFRSIRVAPADELAADGSLPLTVTLEERPPRTIGFGAAYGTSSGLSFNAYWRHRNLFGQAERLSVEGEVSEILENSAEDFGYHLDVSFEKPYFPIPAMSALAEASADREILEAYEREGFELFGGIAYEWSEEVTLRGGVLVSQSSIVEDGMRDDIFLVGLRGRATYDDRDDVLDPTEGINASLSMSGFSEALGADRSFLSARLDGSTYFDFGGQGDIVLALRGAVGSITGEETADIPADRRFYAGGGGSVRGYDFQSVGPLDPDGSPSGGRSLVEASAELRIRVFEDYGIVPFVDAGQVFDDSYPDFGEEFQIGAGIGLRYYSDFGPIRLDFAVPVNPRDGDPDFAFYVSIGQSF
ncbi:MAG: autotransporter assembly complex family protein [Azospirillaceae bacterium]